MFEKCTNCTTRVVVGKRDDKGVFCSAVCQSFYRYKGKVVVLINEDAISQAEHTCLFFEAATNVTFIGTPTAGANGDVTTMVLPGNLVVSFTGHNVRHADGRQLQRVEIQPTIKVAPTMRGLVDGRDEILDAAVKFLQGYQSRLGSKP